MIRTVLLVLACALASGSDWPQFLGPHRSGVADDTGLARSWPDAGPALAWKRPVSHGYAGVAISAGRVYLLEREVPLRDVLLCLDLTTGVELWRFAYDAPGRLGYDGSRNTPTIVGDRAVVLGPFGHLHCLDVATRAVLWRRHLVEDFAEPRNPRVLERRAPQWGITQAVIVRDGLVIVAPYALEAGVVALDLVDGRVRWRSPDIGDWVFCHASPNLLRLGGIDQVVTIGNDDGGANPPAVVSGIAADSGALLWQIVTPRRYNVPMPMAVGLDGRRLLVAGGYTHGALILAVDPPADPGGDWRTAVLLADGSLCSPHIHTPVLYRDHLYVQSCDKLHNRSDQGLSCLDLEGRVCWRSADHGADGRQLPGTERGTGLTFDEGPLLVADGLIYTLHGETGELVLLAADPERFQVLGRARVLEARGRQVWGPMALADGMLVVRDRQEMRCLRVRAETTP